jgi:MFS family permease
MTASALGTPEQASGADQARGTGQAGGPGRAGEPSGGPAGRETPLRRNLQFQTLWIGSTASSLGVSVSEIAYPLAILTLTGSPAKAGLFAAVLTLGMLAGTLPGGQMADRYDRRTVVIVAETGRAAVTAAVAVALIGGWLSLPVLLAAALLLGIGQAVTGAARLPLLRSIVPASQLTSALVQDEVRQNGAALAGPPLGGALYGIRALSHAVPFLATAAAFGCSMLGAIAMKAMPGGATAAARPASPSGAEPAAGPPEGADGAAKKRDADMLAGVRVLWHSPILRAAMLLLMLANMIGVGLDLAVIVILRHQQVSSAGIGLALAAGAVGGLAGAPLVKVLHRLQPGVLLLGMSLAWVPILALLAVPFGPVWVAALLFLVMIGVPALRVLLDVLIVRRAPDEQRGRIVAAVMMMISLGMPAGVAGTGLLLQWLSAQAAMLVLVGVLAVGVAYCATKRELWRARWPQ